VEEIVEKMSFATLEVLRMEIEIESVLETTKIEN